MLLHALLRRFDPSLNLASIPNVEISGVEEDSRRVTRGSLFVARGGTRVDGRAYAIDAATRGAAAIASAALITDCPVPQFMVPDPSAAASQLANHFYDNPSHKLKVLGVTGTNGKTTTTYLLREILHATHRRCGVIGTVEIDDGNGVRQADMTTPPAMQLASMLASMRDHGFAACAMEVSSHALDQQRAAGIRFAGAAFTNLTGDHLDYHKTMDRYAAAKARLFDDLPAGAVAAINAEDAASDRMVANSPARVVRWGFKTTADYQARDIGITADASNFVLVTPDGSANVRMPLVGRHNIENALAAASLACEVFGLSVHQVARGLGQARGAPGRLESVRRGQPFSVLVDYAHTDDALENVLSALRPLTKGKLRVMFGCGGDRDPAKRPRMASAARRLADFVCVTTDNPRTENPRAIIDEILQGFGADIASEISAGRLAVVEDRSEAIRQVISSAAAGDIVLLAGKGHENYQIVGSVKHHFDDREAAAQALAETHTAIN